MVTVGARRMDQLDAEPSGAWWEAVTWPHRSARPIARRRDSVRSRIAPRAATIFLRLITFWLPRRAAPRRRLRDRPGWSAHSNQFHPRRRHAARISHANDMPTHGQTLAGMDRVAPPIQRRRNDGFVQSASGPVAMGYWTRRTCRGLFARDHFPTRRPLVRFPARSNTAEPPLPASGLICGHGQRSADRRPAARPPRHDLGPPGQARYSVAELLLQLPAHHRTFPSGRGRRPRQRHPGRPVLRRCGLRRLSRIRDHRPRLHLQLRRDGFARYGFRVPAVVISPWSRRDHVTSVLHDHTSILAMLERKWNLPPLTARDAAADTPLSWEGCKKRPPDDEAPPIEEETE